MKKTVLIIFLCFILSACGKNTDEITVISREDGSGTRGVFTEIFGIIEKNGNNRTDKTSREAVITNKTDVMLINVSKNPSAVGYVSTGTVTDKVKLIKIDGIMPTAENIKNGSYAAARQFNIVVKDDITEIAKDFIGFILSAQGQEIISQNYIPKEENPKPYTPSGRSGKITVSGSSSVTPVMEKLREAYIELNPQMQIEVQMSDSTSGITNTADGICDIGMSSRHLKESEEKNLNIVTIAMDGIAVIVNPQNPIESMSKDDVKDIFTGKKTKWRELSYE